MQTMRFDQELDRWMIFEGEQQRYAMRCGYGIVLEVENEFFQVSLEYDTEWYVNLGKAKFWLHRKSIYKVQSLF